MSLIFTPVMAQEHDLVEMTPTPEDAESMAGFFHYSPCAGHGYRASRWGSGVESFTTTGMATGLRCACRQAMRRDHI